MIRDWLVEPLLTASLLDWLDIALLTVVIYYLLRAMQATRAFQSLVGLSLLFVVHVVSDWLHFSTLHWVLDNLFEFVVIALLILFQDDIRRALAKAGGTFFNPAVPSPRRSEAGVMEEVIKACFALAHRKIGALIVIERSMTLERFTEGAHPLDAVVSTELLQSLFHPSSPLHDGAVVVSGERIVAAGVFLPISLSKELSRAWGTRHRAAIGVTEASDGLCLVVSEERGTVALVKRGTVTPVADANDLRQQLVEKLDETDVKTEVVTPERVGG